MSAPFKPGDRVRVTDWTAPGYPGLGSLRGDLRVGDTGTVARVEGGAFVDIVPDRPGANGDGWYYQRFELITEPETVSFEEAWQPGNEIDFTVRGVVGEEEIKVRAADLITRYLTRSTVYQAGFNFRILSKPEPEKTFTLEFTEDEIKELLRGYGSNWVTAADKLNSALGIE